MAIDINKKFLYINRDTTIGEMDEALCFPVSSFIGAETQTSSVIDLYFKGSKSTDATVVRIVHEQHGLIKTFYKNLVNEINFGENAFINIYDHGRRNTFPSDISFNISTDVQPTFTLQDTDFIVAGDNLTFDSVQLTGIQTSSESFADNDVSLMTSAAIDDRINTAVAGAASGDMTGVSISVGTGLDISQSNTTSGDYSATINLDLTEVGVSGSANQLLTDDGDGTVTSESELTYDGGIFSIESASSQRPSLRLTNTNTDAEGVELTFKKSATGADNDVIGTTFFIADNDADEPITYAQTSATIKDASDTDEAGQYVIQVTTSNGTTSNLRNALFAEGSPSANDVDVTIGHGSTSTTTIGGDLKVNSGNIYGKTDNDLLLRSDDDIALLLDGDNDGTSAVKITNGAGSNVVIIAESGSIYTAGEIDLGHLNDTTLARHPSGGKVTIEGNEIVTAGAVSVASGSQTAVGMQIARRTITQAEANAMNSTPIEIVPAQGANTVIVVLGGMIRVDRAATQTSSSADLHFHYEGEEPGVFGQSVIYHHRRFMHNELTDRVFHISPSPTGNNGFEIADSLTEDVNAAIEASFDAAITTNSVNSIDVYLNYQVIDIS